MICLHAWECNVYRVLVVSVYITAVYCVYLLIVPTPATSLAIGIIEKYNDDMWYMVQFLIYFGIMCNHTLSYLLCYYQKVMMFNSICYTMYYAISWMFYCIFCWNCKFKSVAEINKWNKIKILRITAIQVCAHTYYNYGMVVKRK